MLQTNQLCILHQSTGDCPISFVPPFECLSKHGSWLLLLLSDFQTFVLKSLPSSIITLCIPAVLDGRNCSNDIVIQFI